LEKHALLALVVGCSHLGVEEILTAASAVNSHVNLLLGGLHLVKKSWLWYRESRQCATWQMEDRPRRAGTLYWRAGVRQTKTGLWRFLFICRSWISCEGPPFSV